MTTRDKNGFTTIMLVEDTLLRYDKGIIEIKGEKYFQNDGGDFLLGQKKLLSTVVNRSHEQWTLTFNEYDTSDPNIEILKLFAMQQTYRHVRNFKHNRAVNRILVGCFFGGLANGIAIGLLASQYEIR